MRLFEKHDWYGLAGAECSKDGRLPMLNETDNPLNVLLVISEGSTQMIMVIDPDDDDCNDTACWDLAVTYDVGILIAPEIEKRLVECKNTDDIENKIVVPFGFTKIM